MASSWIAGPRSRLGTRFQIDQTNTHPSRVGARAGTVNVLRSAARERLWFCRRWRIGSAKCRTRLERCAVGISLGQQPQRQDTQLGTNETEFRRYDQFG